MKHWEIELTNGSYILTLDVESRSANVITEEVITELSHALNKAKDGIAHSEGVRRVVIRSGKSNGFIMGADVNFFDTVQTAEQAAKFCMKAHNTLNMIADIPVPVIAVIDGTCLGGGLELALACDYRIVEENSKLGLPEVNLGILPGFGGTIRLPKLIGHLPALNMMLTGRPVSGRAAGKMGLADVVVPRRHLMSVVEEFNEKPSERKISLLNKLIGMRWVRPLIAKYMEKQVAKKAAKQHYPAPYKMIELWKDCNEVQEIEAMALGRLLVSDTSRNLVRVFNLGEEAKREGKKHYHGVRRVHVIGAGVMGGDIAAWCALKGFQVTLQDLSVETIGKAIGRAHKLFTKKLKKPHLVQQTMNNLIPDPTGEGVYNADLVIEAVVENLEVKRKIFNDVIANADNDTILATNTSSIPLEDIAEGLPEDRRGNLIGLHFFNPVPQMQLVEIVKGENSEQDFINRALSFTVAIGKLPLNVASSPGFLVNRVLMPYMMKALELYITGKYTKEAIDEAMVDFGMPMGPLYLADVVGLDICLAVAKELADHVEVSQKAIDWLRSKVTTGRMGVKSNDGVYQYKKGKMLPFAHRFTLTEEEKQEIVSELLYVMYNEAVGCISRKVVETPNDVDLGMVYGTGFAPFRGGLMTHFTENFNN